MAFSNDQRISPYPPSTVSEPVEDKTSPRNALSAFHTHLQRFKHEPNPTVTRKSPRLANESPSSSITPRTSLNTPTRKTRHLSQTNLKSSPASDVSYESKSSRTQRRRSNGRRRTTTTTPKNLPPLTDIIRPNLLLLFVGLNPGVSTSLTQHCYAHPSNLFYKLLHSSGLTSRRHSPVEDVTFPELYNYGFTNIIPRPTKDGSELKQGEYIAGAKVLEDKIAQYKPEIVCCVGKGIWDGIFRARHGKGLPRGEFEYGWQAKTGNLGVTNDWKGATVFVAASTSGQSASLRPHEKEAIWRPLGEHVKSRRQEIQMTGSI